MRFFITPLASVLFASAQAAYLNNDLSFGHNDRISPTLRAIPNFHLIGSPNPPEILSNKVILTPPAPGNQRGGIWAEKPLEHSDWTVDVDFRATGPERGGGNLQIWYVRKGQHDVGTSSIYTAGRFDGLAIVIDQYAGSGGFVRGFLNDGTKEYKSHHAVDSLAFGHCQYSYRNLGRPSRVSIIHSPNSFKVTLDGTTCFESNKIKLPLGNSFGVSAASASDPDSFEVFKFVTTTESHSPDVHGQTHEQPMQDHPAQNKHAFLAANQEPEKRHETQQATEEYPAWKDLPDVAADQVSSSQQFADVHNRIQALTRHHVTTSRDLVHYINLAATRHKEIQDLLHKLEVFTAPMSNVQGSLNRIENMERKLDQINTDVRATKADLHNALDQHVSNLKLEVRDTHHTLLGTVKGAATSTGKFILVIVGSQLVTVGAYLLYKKRKGGSHKKYL